MSISALLRESKSSASHELTIHAKSCVVLRIHVHVSMETKQFWRDSRVANTRLLEPTESKNPHKISRDVHVGERWKGREREGEKGGAKVSERACEHMHKNSVNIE